MSRISRWHFCLVGLALAALSALLRFVALSQTPFANGWDSYFYLVQLKSMEETGRMHSPEASLIYPYLQLFYRLTGDYVLGLKVGTAVLAGTFTAIVYWLALNRVHKPAFPWGPVALASWSVYSPQLTYFAAQYPKNLLGLVLLVAMIGSLDRLRLSRFSKPGKSWLPGKSGSWLVILFLLIINYFAHRF
ncbi:MAG TPA: hypothetical protein PK228_11435, partial [Saprospiraceae bacterium]|nr:hypothetical protein [Saprospiraceae bacterium]